MRLTSGERALLKRIAREDQGGGVWTVDVCFGPADNATLGSLYRKSLVRRIGDASCVLTEEGYSAIR